MSLELPEPLVPVDCDLRDFAFLPIDITRLFDSEFHARTNDAEWRAGITLWLKSFHQVPAASLPDDDVLLTRLAEYGRDIESWKAVRKMALWGWVKCSDGRWYHPHIAMEANKAWEEHLRIMGKENRRLEMLSGEWEEIRKLVFVRDDYTCTYCGNKNVRLECDHVVPISRGGKTELSNLVTACLPCNRSKGRKSVGEWLQ